MTTDQHAISVPDSDVTMVERLWSVKPLATPAMNTLLQELKFEYSEATFLLSQNWTLSVKDAIFLYNKTGFIPESDSL